MKQFIFKMLRGFWYLLWYSLAGSIVLVAAVFGLARLLLPMVGDYNQDLEKFAQEQVNRPIKIMSLDAEWHGFSPSLVLNNVRLLSKDSKETLLQVSRARLDFNIYEMLKTKQVQFSRFGLSGADLSIVRLVNGEFALAGFESSSIEAGEPDEEGEVIGWLLAQGEIQIHARNLIFNDQLKNNKRYHFSDLTLTLRNDLYRHLIDGAVAFGDREDQELVFAMDARGDITKVDQWSGSVYMSGANLDISKIFGSLVVQGNQLKVGASNFQLWSEWQKGSMVAMQGDISLANINLHAGKNAVPLLKKSGSVEVTTVVENGIRNDSPGLNYNNVIGRFKWEKYLHGWRILADNLILVNEHRVWPSSEFALHYYVDETSGQRISLQSSFLRIEDITPVLPFLHGEDSEIVTTLNDYSPAGDIKNINFNWVESNQQYDLLADLHKVNVKAVDKFPEVSGLTGLLRLHNDSGSFSFNTEKSSFSVPDVFRWAIPVRRVKGTVYWENSHEEFVLTSRDLILDSDDIQSKAVFDLIVPKQAKQSPFISLITHFENGDLSKVSTYYPVSIMSEGALSWLDTAIVQGNLVSGKAVVYGPLDEFPFTKGQGIFDARLKAKNVILDYAEDWPKLHEAEAEAIFRGKTFKVSATKAKIFDSDVRDIEASTRNLSTKVLKINMDGKIIGKTQNKINYMLTAPQLRKKYESGLSDLRTTGNSNLDLSLLLSIGNEVDADVKGKISFKDNTLELVQVPHLMDSINGEVRFNNGNFKGRGLKANLLAQPVNLSVSTRKSSGRNKYNIVEYRAVGKFNAKSIAKSQFPLFHDMVDGDSSWVVKFLVPEANVDPQLVIDTNLKGVSLNLPVPFKKEKHTGFKLKVATAFRKPTQSMMKVSYGGKFESIIEANFTDDFWLTRGEARFGGGPAVLPEAPGLKISGDISEASYDVWKNLIDQLVELKRVEREKAAKTGHSRKMDKPAVTPGIKNIEPEPDPYFTLVNSIDLDVKNFEVFGQKDTNARIRMDNKQTWLAVNIESDKFSGNLKVPDDLDSKPLVLDMNKLNITPLEESGGKIDPRELPAIKLNSRSLNYGNKRLGHVAAETSKQPNGLLVEQLIVKPRASVIKGHGTWVVEGDDEQASLELNIESKDVGKTMKDLGYVGTIADGEGRMTARLQWPASILDPDLYQISGEVSMAFEDGRILDIEPGGAARLFGLFSLQTLPRRLTLDFSDLFSKGLKFDEIKGDFNIENGDAYTSNLELVGPNANVLLKGRIGIGAQDYDQKVRVTPHITDTTILLSIITSQPLLFFFQQLLKQDIDAATSFEYALSGTWDNYKLTPILKKTPKPEQPDEF